MATAAETAVLVAALINAPKGAAGGTQKQADLMAAEVETWLSTGTQGAYIACTFTDTGDLVGDVAHGLAAGDIVVFDAIVTTTGLTEGTEYFVLASGLTADAFKVSATDGGSAVALTSDGTGTYAKRTYPVATAQTAVLTSAQALAGNAQNVRQVTKYAAQIADALLA